MYEDSFYDLDEEYDEDLDDPMGVSDYESEELESTNIVSDSAKAEEPVQVPTFEEVTIKDSIVSFDAEPEPESKEYDAGEVSATKRSDAVQYPYLFMEADVLAQHKLVALRSMLVSKTADPDVTMYSVYLKCQGQILKIGETSSFALRSILTSSVFTDFKKFIKLSEDQKIEGDMMFALCGVKI